MKGSLFGHLRINRKCKAKHYTELRSGRFADERQDQVELDVTKYTLIASV